MVKKITLTIVLAFSLVGMVAFATQSNPAKPDKDTICHATGSQTNPYVRIVVNWNAINGHFNNNGSPLQGHQGDLLFEGEVDCPGGDNGGGGGGDCDLPALIIGFDVQNATLNDNKLELVWNTSAAPLVDIQWGFEDGNWDWSLENTPNDGFEVISGLTNGIHYWFQIRSQNDCGNSNWSQSVDPLP